MFSIDDVLNVAQVAREEGHKRNDEVRGKSGRGYSRPP